VHLRRKPGEGRRGEGRRRIELDASVRGMCTRRDTARSPNHVHVRLFFFLIGSDDGKKNSLAIHPCIHRDLFLSFRGPDGT
jgi:hypothetical protein